MPDTNDILEHLPTNVWPGFDKFKSVQARVFRFSSRGVNLHGARMQTHTPSPRVPLLGGESAAWLEAPWVLRLGICAVFFFFQHFLCAFCLFAAGPFSRLRSTK